MPHYMNSMIPFLDLHNLPFRLVVTMSIHERPNHYRIALDPKHEALYMCGTATYINVRPIIHVNMNVDPPKLIIKEVPESLVYGNTYSWDNLHDSIYAV